MWRDPVVLASVTWLVLLLVSAFLVAFLLEWYVPALDPNQTNLQGAYQSPAQHFPFGTDLLGRDQMMRLFSGARISLLVGFVGASVSLIIGVTYGALAAYVGGRVDNAMMRIVDVLYSLPRLIIVILVITAFEGQVGSWLGAFKALNIDPAGVRLLLLFVSLGCVEWLTMARIVRGQVLVLKEAQYVQASLALGQSHFAILYRHILPQLRGLILVYLTLNVPVIILEESFLSFLGLGVQPPMASWGSLISQAARVVNPVQINWWLIIFPAGFLALTLMSLNFLGDALRDAWDPRSKR